MDGAEAAAARAPEPALPQARPDRAAAVVLKSALSLDGRVATAGGDRSGSPARRAACWPTAGARSPTPSAWGSGRRSPTIRCSPRGRLRTLRQPTRVVFDSEARLPLELAAWSRSIARRRSSCRRRRRRPSERIEALGPRAPRCRRSAGDPPIGSAAALAELGRRGITSLLLEGGPTLAGAFLDAGEIDELRLFIAPIVLGGTLARALIAGADGAATMRRMRAAATAMEWERSGDDLLVRARLQGVVGAACSPGSVREIGTVEEVERDADGARLRVGAGARGRAGRGRLGLGRRGLPDRGVAGRRAPSRPT